MLLIMRENNPISISELATISGRKLSTVSRTIERMRNEKLVSTATRKSDQRVTEVNLEEKKLEIIYVGFDKNKKEY